ncbi:hypothetical protein M0Q97_07020 [Candidatus Dojkabacteria bacterium]|jgi:hypothetical protein|nr:hypothetical protein [Candidatus Dojkabacteria bacterium]
MYKLKNFSDKQINYSLMGLILGDGKLNKHGSVYIKHENKQKFYVEWLESICKVWNLKYTVRYSFIEKTSFGEKLYSSIYIRVKDKRHFLINNRIFNIENKKIISKYVINRINDFGLLLWFLDDGNLHVSKKNNKSKRFAYLNTQSFSYEENLLIKKTFYNRFNIEVSIHKDDSGFKKHKNKIYYRIYFNANNFRKFYDIVKKYFNILPEGFLYKFDLKYEINRMKNSSYLVENYNIQKNSLMVEKSGQY